MACARRADHPTSYCKDIVIEVCDDGCGIDPARVGRAGSRGLRHMRERAAHLAGSLRVEPLDPGTGAGTRVALLLPASAPPVVAAAREPFQGGSAQIRDEWGRAPSS